MSDNPVFARPIGEALKELEKGTTVYILEKKGELIRATAGVFNGYESNGDFRVHFNPPGVSYHLHGGFPMQRAPSTTDADQDRMWSNAVKDVTDYSFSSDATFYTSKLIFSRDFIGLTRAVGKAKDFLDMIVSL